MSKLKKLEADLLAVNAMLDTSDRELWERVRAWVKDEIKAEVSRIEAETKTKGASE